MSPLRGLIVPGLIVALAVLGCGRKGPPHAPEVRVPRPPADLEANVVAQEIVIDWSNPNRREDGSPMLDLTKIRLYRREETVRAAGRRGAGAPPSEASDSIAGAAGRRGAGTPPSEASDSIAGENAVRPALRVGSAVHGFAEIAAFDIPSVGRVRRYVDRDVAIGRRYTYVLTAMDSQGRMSAPSPRLSVVLIAAPGPPTALVTHEGETEATLSWDPPRQLIDGTPVTGAITYEVLRSTSADVAPAEIRASRLETEHFTDRRLENEQTYFYAVRAVRTEPVGAATSEPTVAVPVTPRDMTPPSPPSELVAIPSPGTVRLAWRSSPEGDVARVIVYRAQGDGAPVRVGSAEVPRTTFTDRDLPPGTYRYFVTSIDGASRPNESRRSAEVTVTVVAGPAP